MDRPEPAATTNGRAHDERHRALLGGDVPELRRLVDEAVHGQAHEVAEHHLEHGTQPCDGGSVGGAGEGQL